MSLKEKYLNNREPVFLMDGSAFIYRGFFANKNMQRSDGFPTNSLFVVTRLILKILKQEKPKYFAFIKDGHGKNFRHEIYSEYKANREAMPEDLVKQLDPILNMVRALGIHVEISDKVEADDIIASLAKRFSTTNPVVIVSGDKDLKQCLNENVFMWDPSFKDEKWLTKEIFSQENGISPDRWPDMQALIGDSSDNIPGVPSIGPKTAKQIFEICSSLEEIRDHLNRLPEKLQAKLSDHLDNMFIWRKLTRLAQDICLDIKLENLLISEPNRQNCEKLAKEFELNMLWREMSGLFSENIQKKVQIDINNENNDFEVKTDFKKQEQISLFSLPKKEPTFFEIVNKSDLPICNDKRVVLIFHNSLTKKPCIYVEYSNKEFVYVGDFGDLCQWLLSAREIIVSDMKQFLLSHLKAFDLLSANILFFDLGLAAYLLDPEESNYEWSKLTVRFANVLENTLSNPCKSAILLKDILFKRLADEGLKDLYFNLELPLVAVLANMEKLGIKVDVKAFKEFLLEVEKGLDDITKTIYSYANKEFNLRSSRQLAEILFSDLKLANPKKTKSGQASTNQEVLEKLIGIHPIIDSILEYRKLEKLRSTYLEPLPKLVDQNGRIHTTFNQKGTATGRLSSSNPNLQNIPVRGDLGRRMRACFVAQNDYSLISADYSQVELRVLAHMSLDKELVEAFHNGEDIHARTASLIYDISQNEITKDQRRNAKTINFGLIYGMGAQKLAKELRIKTNEAKKFIDRYFEKLTGLKEFYEQVEKNVKEKGFVTTLGGRRRLLPDIFSNNGQAFALARRQAINTVIQGSAADIIKLAMLKVINDVELKNMGARLLLQVHDELLLEAPINIASQAGMRVAQIMSSVKPNGDELRVPLPVDWAIGNDWGSAH